VLLDLLMPGISGTETCERIKSSPVLRHLPLIMLTANDEPESIVRGMNAGADDYVAKSVSFDVIKARLRAQLRRKQFEDENRRVREEILRQEAETRAARERAEAHAGLLRELEAKNRELETLNGELKSFAYSVSHDLRQPLRSMDGFSKVLLETYSNQLDTQGRHYLTRVRDGARRMGAMIDGLLVLSRATRKQLDLVPLPLDQLAREVIDRLRDHDSDREVELEIQEDMATEGDRQLVESVLENLLGNAWKFTRDRSPARIIVGSRMDGGVQVFFVGDNGVGFAPASAEKMFVPFQRLHSADEFPGTGIGLATTQRIVHRHGGSIWAEGRPGRGATIYFTLDNRQETSS
jgi:light-regulated signal transduction histidine kinase (bacteriophytochrome)